MLPLTLLVTTPTVRRRNDISGKVTRLPSTRQTFHLNLKDRKSVKGPAYYRVTVSPNGLEPCVAIFLNNMSPPGLNKFMTITGKIRIRVSSSGRYLGDSLWAWENETSSASVIWEGTDNFVNICINELKTIRSQNGRLYCVLSSDSFKKVRRLR